MNVIVGKLIFISVLLLLLWNIISMTTHHHKQHSTTLSFNDGSKFVNRYIEFLQQEEEQKRKEIEEDENESSNHYKMHNQQPITITTTTTKSTTSKTIKTTITTPTTTTTPPTTTTTTTTTTTPATTESGLKSPVKTTKTQPLKGDSFINPIRNVKGKINVYYYTDVCHYCDNFATKWNTLFPRFPARAGLLPNFYDEQPILNGKISRRMIGLLQPDDSDWYSFLIESRMGCEVRLVESNTYQTNDVYDNFLLDFALQKEQILQEDDKREPYKPFKVQSQSVFLHKSKTYMLDVLHAVPLYGFLKLKWKKKNATEYNKIPDQLLSALYAEPEVTDRLPNITYDIEYTSRTEYKEQDRRIFFYRTPTVALENGQTLRECDYTAGYIPKYFPPDHGVAYVKVDRLFPENILVKHHFEGGSYPLYMEKERAHKVVEKVMSLLGRQYQLNQIVHIEENKENEHQQTKRYFVELDVSKHGSPQLYRYSRWVVIRNNGTEILCKPKGYEWNPKEKIYLITPVKNQARWIRFMIHHLNEIVERTLEQNIHLIVYDFNSTDEYTPRILAKARFPYTYMQNSNKEGARFSKVIGLNRAVSSSIVEGDPIIFVLDLQLQLPYFLFDYIRKHTFRRKTTYVPILLRLTCGEHPEFTNLTRNSIWQEIGYGMISIFKSDWQRIGGMNETRFSQKWGGEDWEFIDRVLINKMEVIHHRLPGYYHLYHSNKNTWDGTKN